MTASDRIEALIKRLHTNIKSFSELCGYERPQAFYDILKGKTRNISPTMCDKILAVFPHISRVWLLTGEGPMMVERNEERKIQKPNEENNEQSLPLPNYVPLVNISALAGPLAAYYQPGDDLSKCEKVISPVSGAEIAIPISGESMEPTFPDGSTAYIKRINEAAFIPWGHPMVIATENGVFIKNILPDEENNNYIWAESINPRFPRMHVPKSSISAIYRILCVSKNFPTM